MKRETAFKIRIDGGPERDFVSAHSGYTVAVMEAFGKLELPYPCDVEIWVPDLLPDYGPYFYRIDDFIDNRGNRYLAPSVMHSRGPPLAA